MIARFGSRCVKSAPNIGFTLSNPISDNSVGAISIWLTSRSSWRGAMPAPRISAGIWKWRTGTGMDP
ncbi:hypothetical protein G6F35_017386 [Rhizopus arrhizus]|nr:hypothetical protein G6F35_017386 [Rhizopus arrhizus]